jgi:serine/threonine protein kinase
MTRQRLYGDRWEVLNQIGGGGQGHTFLVRDKLIGGEDYVLKRLLNVDRLDRFQREIEAYSRLHSPHIPKLIDHSPQEPRPYLVTEYVGKDLHHLSKAGDRPPLKEALRRFLQIVEAAQAAHLQGMVHRDIKPNNITIDDDGTVYLIDFGICDDGDEGTLLTTTPEGFGNPSYAAPECGRGSMEKATPFSDMYSLGKVLYWMASHGGYINREDTERVEETIRDSSPPARHYVGTLVKRAVQEVPTSRVSAEQMLELVKLVITKLEEHDELRSTGLVPVLDGFGPDFSFYASGSRSVTSPPRGNPPLDGHLAFGVEPTFDLEIDGVQLAMRRSFGSGDELELAVVADDGGYPGGGVLAHATLRVPEGTTIVRWSPTEPVSLKRNRLYWVTLSAGLPDSDLALCSAHEILWNSRANLIGERIGDGDWNVFRTSGYAVRILGRS